MGIRLEKSLLIGSVLGLFSMQGHSYSGSFFVSGGPNYSTLQHQRDVQINEDVINSYQVYKKNNWNSFWGIGGNYPILTQSSPYQLLLGAAGYFFHLGQVKGIEFPFSNEGLFDALRYRFQAKSDTLFAEARLIYSPFPIKPFILLGLGKGWNRFYNYEESAANPELSAAPAASFSNHTKQRFAYEVGVGVQSLLFEDKKNAFQCTGAVGYHYFNLGQAALGRSSEQSFGQGLHVKRLHTQGAVFSLIFSA